MEEMVLKNVKPFEIKPRDFRFDFKNIVSVYDGRLNSCACGCSGDYYYTSHSDEPYNVDDDKVKDIIEAFVQRSEEVQFQRGLNSEWVFELVVENKCNDDEEAFFAMVTLGYRVYMDFNNNK